MPFEEIITAYYENDMKQIHTLWAKFLCLITAVQSIVTEDSVRLPDKECTAYSFVKNSDY
jgi:hypothetical protein